MHKSPLVLAFLLILSTVTVLPVHASVSVNATVNDNIFAVYKFENLNSTVYDEVKANQQFNISTIPTIITKNLEDQGFTQVNWGFGPQTDIFNDTTRTIQVSFYLGGSDIISFTLNTTILRRTYQVQTEWRRFQLSLTSNFVIDFTQYFNPLVEKWQKPNSTTYHIDATGTDFFNLVSFNLVLPASATNVQAAGDTITYEVPPYFEDVFLGTPFVILAVLIVAIIIVLAYRRVR